MTYTWKSAARIKADPQAAGQLFESLEAQGKLTPANVVQSSQPTEAPLHGEFEWDDDVAADLYRQRQAGHLMRCIVTVQTNQPQDQPVRAFYPVRVESAPRQYVSLNTVLQTPALYDDVLERAKREMRAFVDKYHAIDALRPVLDPLEAFLEADKTA